MASIDEELAAYRELAQTLARLDGPARRRAVAWLGAWADTADSVPATPDASSPCPVEPIIVRRRQPDLPLPDPPPDLPAAVQLPPPVPPPDLVVPPLADRVVDAVGPRGGGDVVSTRTVAERLGLGFERVRVCLLEALAAGRIRRHDHDLWSPLPNPETAPATAPAPRVPGIAPAPPPADVIRGIPRPPPPTRVYYSGPPKEAAARLGADTVAVVAEMGRAREDAMAARFGISRSGVIQRMRKLERAGLVERGKDDEGPFWAAKTPITVLPPAPPPAPTLRPDPVPAPKPVPEPATRHAPTPADTRASLAARPNPEVRRSAVSTAPWAAKGGPIKPKAMQDLMAFVAGRPDGARTMDVAIRFGLDSGTADKRLRQARDENLVTLHEGFWIPTEQGRQVAASRGR